MMLLLLQVSLACVVSECYTPSPSTVYRRNASTIARFSRCTMQGQHGILDLVKFLAVDRPVNGTVELLIRVL